MVTDKNFTGCNRMKEVTYKNWQKNPTPRMMWVWNNDVENKEKRKVIYMLNNDYTYRVLSSTADDSNYEIFKHCAEIEEPKTRRMTNKELSRWLREKPTREWKWTFDSYIYSVYYYDEQYADKEVDKNISIREDDGEWREPLVEDHYKD